jgi:hypothetical protein
LRDGESRECPDHRVAGDDGGSVVGCRGVGQVNGCQQELAAGAPPSVDAQVHQDPAGVGPSVAVARLAPRAVGALEGRLNEIIGARLVAAQQLGSVQQVRADGVDECGELLCAVADLLDVDAR